MKFGDIEKEILSRLYDDFFENYVIGKRYEYVVRNINSSDNEIAKSMENLKSNNLIKEKRFFYVITVQGLDYFEQVADTHTIKENIDERKKILQILKKGYDEYVYYELSREQLEEYVPSKSKNHRLAQIDYLTEKQYVSRKLAMGGFFSIALTSHGNEFIEELNTESSMSNTELYAT